MSTASRWLAVAPDGLLLEEAGALEDTEEPAGLEEDGAFAGCLELAEEECGLEEEGVLAGSLELFSFSEETSLVSGFSEEDSEEEFSFTLSCALLMASFRDVEEAE